MEEIKNVTAVPLLQQITLHLDVGAAFLLGYIKIDFARSAAMLIDHFAKLNPVSRAQVAWWKSKLSWIPVSYSGPIKLQWISKMRWVV